MIRQGGTFVKKIISDDRRNFTRANTRAHKRPGGRASHERENFGRKQGRLPETKLTLPPAEKRGLRGKKRASELEDVALSHTYGDVELASKLR